MFAALPLDFYYATRQPLYSQPGLISLCHFVAGLFRFYCRIAGRNAIRYSIYLRHGRHGAYASPPPGRKPPPGSCWAADYGATVKALPRRYIYLFINYYCHARFGRQPQLLLIYCVVFWPVSNSVYYIYIYARSAYNMMVYYSSVSHAHQTGRYQRNTQLNTGLSGLRRQHIVGNIKII